MNKDQQYNIWQRFKNFIERFIECLYDRYNTSIVYNVIVFSVSIGIVVVLGFCLRDSLKLDELLTLCVILITAIISFMLMLEQHRVAEAQEKSNIEQRYNNAISQIESKRQGVVRIGFQTLYELALEERLDNKIDNIRKVFTDYLKQKSRASKKNVKNKISQDRQEIVVFILKLLIKTKFSLKQNEKYRKKQ